MNTYTASQIQQQRTVGLKGAVESFEMFDSLGNCAAAALFKLDGDQFEVALWDFNNCVSVRYRNTLAICKNVMEHFFYARERDGFTCATEPPQFPNKP